MPPADLKPAAVYDQAVRDLAKLASGAGTLAAPTAAATAANPMCGDEVRLELAVSGSQISELAHRTRGCLLCSASASLLAQIWAQKQADTTQLLEIHAQIKAMLEGGNIASAAEMFAPVAGRPSRHACVLLPWQALAEALHSTAG